MNYTVLKEFNERVLLLTLNRPSRKNAFNTEQWLTFSTALDEARENDEVNVVIINGAGEDFSSGQDLTDFSDVSEGGESPYKICERALAKFDKPLIGAAKGFAVGGGATILFYCDILYVGNSLRMRLPFTSLGLVPEFASSYLLQTNIGRQRAAELFYTAEWIDADMAVETGMAAHKFSDDKLLNNALMKATEIARWPLNAIRETKRCLNMVHKSGIDAAFKMEHAGMDKQAGSPENMEAISAFLEKRRPDFYKLKS